uniref:Uncharacterized protein n=1 Tax=Octactis speculum TaxID=3111310 RepID=A0A7S2CLV0_9STRA
MEKVYPGASVSECLEKLRAEEPTPMPVDALVDLTAELISKLNKAVFCRDDKEELQAIIGLLVMLETESKWPGPTADEGFNATRNKYCAIQVKWGQVMEKVYPGDSPSVCLNKLRAEQPIVVPAISEPLFQQTDYADGGIKTEFMKRFEEEGEVPEEKYVCTVCYPLPKSAGAINSDSGRDKSYKTPGALIKHLNKDKLKLIHHILLPDHGNKRLVRLNSTENN